MSDEPELEFVEAMIFSPDAGPRDVSGWAWVEPGRFVWDDPVEIKAGETLTFTIPSGFNDEA